MVSDQQATDFRSRRGSTPPCATDKIGRSCQIVRNPVHVASIAQSAIALKPDLRSIFQLRAAATYPKV